MVITGMERCLMIATWVTSIVVPFWKTGQLFSRFKNGVITEALRC